MKHSPPISGLTMGSARLPAALAGLLANVDEGLLARKGLLYLCCPHDTDSSAMQSAYASYYGSSSFDVLPCLENCLEPLLVNDAFGPVAGIVARGVDVTLLATVGISAVHLKENNAYRLLRQAPPSRSELAQSRPLFRDQARMAHGDRIAVWSPGAATPPSPDRLRGALRRVSTARRAAHRLSHTQRGASVLILEAPALYPARELGPVRASLRSKGDRAAVQERSGRSPVSLALAVLLLALTGFYWIRRPSLDRIDWSTVGAWLLTPVASPTSDVPPTPVAPTAVALSPTPPDEAPPTRPVAPAPLLSTSVPEEGSTPEPTPVDWAAPSRLFPGMDAQMGSGPLTFRWVWDGDLGEDQHFDLRIWVMGAKVESVAWTKEKQYNLAQSEGGWHTWQVALIQGTDGNLEQELAISRMVNFYWAAGDSPIEATPTLVPPTRVNPEPGPTRGTPSADESTEASSRTGMQHVAP